MVAAVILAAGAGRRLGGINKALLSTADGGSFLEAIATTLAAAGITDIVVVIGPPHQADTFSEVTRLGLGCTVNPDPDRGMGSSVAAGFDHASRAFARSCAALLWPVDHPRVAVATVRAVAAAADEASAVIPTHADRGGHPTAFGRKLWPALAGCDRLPMGARSVINAHSTQKIRVAVADPGITADVDLPGDLG